MYTQGNFHNNKTVSTRAFTSPVRDIRVDFPSPSPKQTIEVKIDPAEQVKALAPFETISIAEFQQRHLPNVDEAELREEFKAALYKEVEEGKISKIKYYRIISRLTQKELAKRIGTQQPNIARIEQKGYTPDIDTLKRLAKVFSIKYTEFLE